MSNPRVASILVLAVMTPVESAIVIADVPSLALMLVDKKVDCWVF